MSILPSKQPSDGHLFPGPVDALAGKTYPGQAYFAGTGPVGAGCSGCAFYAAGPKKADGTYKAGACGKYRNLTGKPGPAFSPSASACKYYEARPPTPMNKTAANEAA